LLGTNALNERYLLAGSFQLAERLIIIKQFDIRRREVAIAQHLGNLFALERRGTHNSNPVQIGSPCLWVRDGGFYVRAHEVCDASRYAGGGLPFRLKIHCNRQKTPETMYSSAIAKSTYREKNQISANNPPNRTIRRKGWRDRKSISLPL